MLSIISSPLVLLLLLLLPVVTMLLLLGRSFPVLLAEGGGEYPTISSAIISIASNLVDHSREKIKIS